MHKYLVQIEFRYKALREDMSDTQRGKMVTIGVYDTFLQACEAGNELMSKLESRFKLKVYYDGQIANRERFSENGGAFRTKRDSISSIGYLQTPFEFFAKITQLQFDDVDAVIDEVMGEVRKCVKHVFSRND